VLLFFLFPCCRSCSPRTVTILRGRSPASALAGTYRVSVARAATGTATAEKRQITGRVSGLGANHHATARSDGTWTILNAVSGDYNVNATHSLYTSSPAFHHAVARTSDVHNMNFTAHPKNRGRSTHSPFSGEQASVRGRFCGPRHGVRRNDSPFHQGTSIDRSIRPEARIMGE